MYLSFRVAVEESDQYIPCALTRRSVFKYYPTYRKLNKCVMKLIMLNHMNRIT